MARTKKIKQQEKIIEYPEPPFGAVLVEAPTKTHTMVVGDIYKIADVYINLGKTYFVVHQDIRGVTRETYWLADRFDVIES